MTDDKIPTLAPRVPADLPELLKWANVIRRCISVSKSCGYAIVTIRVVVDADGTPVHYAAPTLTKLEPKAESIEVITQLLANLTQ